MWKLDVDVGCLLQLLLFTYHFMNMGVAPAICDWIWVRSVGSTAIELQAVVWVLEISHVSSAKQQPLLSTEPSISQLPHFTGSLTNSRN